MRPDLRDIEDRLGMTAEFGGRISLDRHEAEEIANALAQARKAATSRPARIPFGLTLGLGFAFGALSALSWVLS